MQPQEEDRLSLCEVLDRVLNKGIVLQGDIVISVADIDLLYLRVRLLLTSVETARQAGLLLQDNALQPTQSPESKVE
jgi:hypothetical protein